MEAYRILDVTFARGEAEKIGRLIGKSADLINSYRRPPRSPENPFGTGNYSPVHYYLQFCEWRKPYNPDGLLRMHRLVTAEIEEGIVELVAAESLKTYSQDILTRACEAVNRMNERELREASYAELTTLDECLGRLASALDISRASIRAELRRREVPRVKVESRAS